MNEWMSPKYSFVMYHFSLIVEAELWRPKNEKLVNKEFTGRMLLIASNRTDQTPGDKRGERNSKVDEQRWLSNTMDYVQIKWRGSWCTLFCCQDLCHSSRTGIEVWINFSYRISTLLLSLLDKLQRSTTNWPARPEPPSKRQICLGPHYFHAGCICIQA